MAESASGREKANCVLIGYPSRLDGLGISRLGSARKSYLLAIQ